MTQNPFPEQFYLLIDALVSERIKPTEHRQLQDLLRQNPAAQAEYLAVIKIHLELRKLLDAPAFDSPPTPRKSIPLRRISVFRNWSIGLVALLLIIGLFVSLDTFRDNSLDPVARMAPVAQRPAKLSQIAQAELFGELTPKLNSELPFDRTFTLIKGQMELTFAKGATALIQAPAIFCIDSEDTLNMKIGSCSVHSPPGAEGFQVMTPRTEIVDLGTRFFVDVSEVGQSEIQVIEGAAAVQSATDGDSPARTINQGHAIRLNAQTDKAETIAFNGQGYQRQLPDRVMSYEAIPLSDADFVQDLKSVTVQRDGQAINYPVEELIGIEVLHFMAGQNRTNVAWVDQVPQDPAAMLESDVALNTGVINPGGRRSSEAHLELPAGDYHLRPGMAIQFRQPVQNGPGPDMVLFEIQSPVYPAEGDHFRVSPLQATPGLHDHLINHYDITLNSRNSLRVAPFHQIQFSTSPQSIEDLRQFSRRVTANFLPSFSAIAVGIDFSDLGYSSGAMVESVFLEDAGTDELSFDPVFIAGFPPLRTDEADK